LVFIIILTVNILLGLKAFILYRPHEPVPQQTDLAIQDTETEAKRIAKDCFSANKDSCYKNDFIDLTQKTDFFFAQRTLDFLQDIDPITRNCHVLAHEIAKSAIRKTPSDWEDLISKINADTCGGGYLHGILEAHTGDDPDFRITSEFIRNLCIRTGGDLKNYKTRTCAHILGHLMLVKTYGDMYAALPVCADLPDELSLECYNGVFMEDSFKLALAEHGLGEIPVRDKARMERQRARCVKYDGTAGAACWTDMAEIFAELYDFDPKKTFQSCQEAPVERERIQCYQKAIIIITASPAYDDTKKLLGVCAPYQGQDPLYRRCLHFMNAAATHYSLKLADRSISLCSKIERKFQKDCFQDLGGNLHAVGATISQQQEICGKAPEEFRDICINGKIADDLYAIIPKI